VKMMDKGGKSAPKKRLMDKYGRSLTVTEAAKRQKYRESLKGARSADEAAAMRDAEMKRRAQFRKTTSLQGAKGPGKAQAQMEARRMAGQGPKARKGASSTEAMRMGRASARGDFAAGKSGGGKFRTPTKPMKRGRGL